MATEQTQEQSREIATINGKHYFKDSMSDELVEAFNQAIQINDKIRIKEMEIRDLKYARQYLIDFIDDNKDSMQEYVIPEQKDSDDSEDSSTVDSDGETNE